MSKLAKWRDEPARQAHVTTFTRSYLEQARIEKYQSVQDTDLIYMTDLVNIAADLDLPLSKVGCPVSFDHMHVVAALHSCSCLAVS